MATTTRHVLLEVAIASADDAVTAQNAGANRLELNAALTLGGLTPSLGTLLEVRQAVALPLVVMIRPRPGGFAYSSSEFAVMCKDLELAAAHGADGIALGVLHPDGTIDRERCRALLERCRDTTAVFHRAFDVTPEPFTALETLIELGFRRVLTSGQEASAYNGAARIAALIRRAAGRIEVLPGGGINRFSVADVVARTGCDQVHASLRGSRPDVSVSARPQVAFGSALHPAEDRYDATSPEAVAALRAALDA